MAELELRVSDTGLVGTQALDGLQALFLVQETSTRDVVVEAPVDDGGGDNGQKADEEEDAEREVWSVKTQATWEG